MALILVVDDEDSVRLLLRDTLELDAYDVIEASDGPQALSEFEQHRPDGVILDIMMPGMSGIDVLREIRGTEAGAEVPVILLTAAGDDKTTWDGWSAGASVYLTKPFDPDNLLSWVERMLS
jgi:two-component system OmpR family response regulator/two-component system alkaline phosphatase synthesis response regulator PhoP